MKKKRILFVGSFKNAAADGSVGGQMFACRTLVNSHLTDKINFIKIDTTAKSVPSPPIIQRIPFVLFRFFQLFFHLIFSRIDKALIFTAEGTSFMEKGLMVLICKIFRKDVILAPRSGMILDDIKRNGKLKKFIKYIFSKSDYVVCQSTFWKAEFVKLTVDMSTDKFIIQPNWIDEKIYQATYIPYEEKNKDEFINILYIGWLEEFKGIIDLIYAVDKLKETNQNFHLYVYGSGSLKIKLQELITTFKIGSFVTLEGWADQQAKIKAFQNAHLYVLPSHKEGFPNSLLEAMISELPVLATEIGAIHNIIEDKKNGIITPSKNPDSLAEKIKLLIDDPALRTILAQSAKSTVVSNYTTKRALRNLGEFLVN